MLMPETGQMERRQNLLKITSSAIMNVKRLSFTRRYTSESASDLSALLIPVVRRDMTTSQSSSMFLQERNVPVFSRTCDSMMKKPVISCVYVGREERRSDAGRIKSDWACAHNLAATRRKKKDNTCLSIGLIRISELFKKSQGIIYVYALKEWFEIHFQLVIV
jgi:hypothetical protein